MLLVCFDPHFVLGKADSHRADRFFELQNVNEDDTTITLSIML